MSKSDSDEETNLRYNSTLNLFKDMINQANEAALITKNYFTVPDDYELSFKKIEEYCNLEKEEKSLKKDILQLEELLKEENAALEEKERINKELSEEAINQQKRIHEMRESVKTLNIENLDLNHEVDSLNKEIEGFEKEITELEAEETKMEEAIQKVQKELGEVNKGNVLLEIAELEKEIKEVSTNINEMNDLILDLEYRSSFREAWHQSKKTDSEITPQPPSLPDQ